MLGIDVGTGSENFSLGLRVVLVVGLAPRLSLEFLLWLRVSGRRVDLLLLVDLLHGHATLTELTEAAHLFDNGFRSLYSKELRFFGNVGRCRVDNDELLYVVSGSQFQRSLAFELVFGSSAGTTFQEQRDDSRLPRLCGMMQRSPPLVVQHVHISTRLQQVVREVNLPGMGVEHSIVQRRAAGVVLHVDQVTVAEKHRELIDIAAAAGVVECGPPRRVFVVGVGVVVEQQLDHGLVAVLASEVQGRAQQFLTGIDSRSLAEEVVDQLCVAFVCGHMQS